MMKQIEQPTTLEATDDSYEFFKIVSRLTDQKANRSWIESVVIVAGAAAVTLGALWVVNTAAVAIWRFLTCAC